MSARPAAGRRRGRRHRHRAGGVRRPPRADDRQAHRRRVLLRHGAHRRHRELRLPDRLRPRLHAAPGIPLGELRAGLRRHARRRRRGDDPLPAVDRADGDGDRRPRRRRHAASPSRCRRGGSCSVRSPPPRDAGFTVEVRQRDRVLPVQAGVRRRPRRRLPDADAELAVPRGLQHPADDQGGGRRRGDPARARRRRAARSSSPRARPAAASTRSTSRSRTPSRWRTSTCCSRTPSRRSPRRTACSATFMAKPHFDDAGSSFHVHSSLWSPTTVHERDGRRRRAPHERRVPLVPRRPAGHGGGVLAARRADGQQLQAVPAGELGADRHRLGHRQPHARVPRRRPRAVAARWRTASPAPTPTPTTCSRRRSPADCTASPSGSSRHRRTSATATAPPTSRASRRRSSRRSSCGEAATSPGRASATTSTTTCCTFAESEWAAFNRTVTDWERRRYFERI